MNAKLAYEQDKYGAGSHKLYLWPYREKLSNLLYKTL
jgi:hypothetical protein